MSGWIEWNSTLRNKDLTKTLAKTLSLHYKSYSVEDIAKTREVKLETIEGQIIELITMSLIDINSIVDKKTQDIILKQKFSSLTELKKLIPDSITWFEIKATLASFNSKSDSFKNK